VRRDVSARIELELRGEVELIFSVAVAGPRAREELSAVLDGAPAALEELQDAHGTRLHRLRTGPGRFELAYSAAVDGGAAAPQPEPDGGVDAIRYLRPSRYCESDSLAPTALAEFAGLRGRPLLDAVSSWVGTHLSYVPGSSQPTDGAVRTLLDRRGVCRDYAHLCTALLRALDVPARVVSVYAPGLRPMDFHAVCEAFVDGRWCVVDATALAPRTSMLRIATGRDAADTAFLTVLHGQADLLGLEVLAVADELPADDAAEVVVLG